MTLKKHLIPMGALLLWAIAPVGLAAQQAKTAEVAPGERIFNLDTLKNEARQYHDCTGGEGCYAGDLDLQADRAIAFLRERAAHKADGEKLALVLDIDETTLSNWEEISKADFAYDSAAFNAWVNAGKAPAIAGTLRLYQEAQKLGVNVFFLTGRAEPQRAVTERNLRAQGFDDWRQLILRSADQAKLSARDFKSAERKKMVAQGYKIVLSVGDQWSDLEGDPMAEYSVKYPDPFYYIP